MKTICFTHEFTLLSFVSTTSNLYNYEVIEDDDNGLTYFKSNELKLLFLTDDFLKLKYHTIRDEVDIFVGWTEINTTFGKDNMKDVRRFLNKNTIFVILDDIGEYSFKFDAAEIYDWVESNDKNYLITQRYPIIKSHERILNNQVYLPLFYYFIDVNDFLFYHPPLPKFDYQKVDTKYDFMCYLGKDSEVADGKPWRKEFIDKIDWKNRSIWYPSTFSSLTDRHKLLRQYVKQTHSDRVADYGQYMLTSLLESLDVKVKVVFESFELIEPELDGTYRDSQVNQQFLTEKTLKCFLYTQPYILILNENSHRLLTEFGYKLPFPSYQNGLLDFINNLMEGDNLEKWIKSSIESFEHNYEVFYHSIKDDTLPYIQFFKKILK